MRVRLGVAIFARFCNNLIKLLINDLAQKFSGNKTSGAHNENLRNSWRHRELGHTGR